MAYLRTSWREKWSYTFPVSTPGYSGAAAAAIWRVSPVIGLRYNFNSLFSVSTETYFRVDTGGTSLPQYPKGVVTTLNVNFSF